MRRICLLLVFACAASSLHAQSIKGKVFGKGSGDGEKEILPGATVHWIGSDQGTTVNENGVFELAADGIAFQRHWESRAYVLGGENYHAPGQLVGDFVAGRHGNACAREFGSVLPSYTPGVHLTDLAEPGRGSLPEYVLSAIREALPAFERQIPGFAMADAVLTGVETRTSSPLRIPRDKNFQSVNVAGLYPAGEGAGYAGGIMSAGVDGIEVAEAVGLSVLSAARAA